MPNYFADYDTTVHFISLEELKAKHSGMPHGGHVIRTGATGLGANYKDLIELTLELDSNPFFTGEILVSFARACYRLNKEGKTGCFTAFDVAPKYLIDKEYDEILGHLL